MGVDVTAITQYIPGQLVSLAVMLSPCAEVGSVIHLKKKIRRSHTVALYVVSGTYETNY